LRYFLSGILYLVVYLGAGALLTGYPLAQSAVANALLLGLALAFCFVVLYRRRQWQGTQRLFWDAFAVGMAMWCVGQIGFTVSALTGQRSWVQWHTMFSLCGGIGPVVAMIARPYRGPRKAATPGVSVDLISFALLMGFVYAYFIMVPSVVATAGPSPEATLLALCSCSVSSWRPAWPTASGPPARHRGAGRSSCLPLAPPPGSSSALQPARPSATASTAKERSTTSPGSFRTSVTSGRHSRHRRRNWTVPENRCVAAGVPSP